MKRLPCLMSLPLVALFAFSCSTKDVDWPDGGEIDPSRYYEVPDRAFGEFLVYNCTTETSADRKLPAGTAFVDPVDGKIYIDKTIAATATNLYVSKASASISRLEDGYPAEFKTAATKIASFDGMQYFTGVKVFTGTSNDLAADYQLQLENLTELEELTVATAGVTTLDLHTLTKLKKLDIRGSTNESLGKLTALDLSNNTNLESVNVSRNRIAPANFVLPTSYASLTDLDLSQNGENNANVKYTVPQDLYDQITTSGKANFLTTESASEPGPEPTEDAYEITDRAFGEFLVYNCTLETSADRQLPEGTAFVASDGKIYIDKTIAATATNLYVSKATASISRLEKYYPAEFKTAATKITSFDGMQYFTGVKVFTGTSNELAADYQLQLENLTELEELTVATAGVTTLDLHTLTKLKVLDIRGSTNESLGKLTALDLSNNTNLESVNVSRNRIDPANFVLPTSYASLTDLNLGMNGENDADVKFTVPQDLYDQVTTSGKENFLTTESASEPGPEPTENAYEITDRAFGEYLLYNCTLETTADRKLPAGTAFEADGKIYIDKTIAATATTLYVNKSSGVMDQLESGYPAEFTTARTKITNMDGMQYFTGIKTLNGTSNELSADGQLQLENLTELEDLIFATAGVSTLDLRTLTKLKKLDIRGSTNESLGKLTALDLSNNTNLVSVNVNRNRIAPANFVLPTSYASLTDLDLGRNGENDANVLFTVPQDLYDQVTTSGKANFLTTGSTSEPEPEPEPETGPQPAEAYYQIPDRAFGEYLLYNCTLETSADRKLPAGTAIIADDGKIYINKAIAATATTLYVNKSSTVMDRLASNYPAEYTTARTKITNMDGMQYFTGIKMLNGTSNELSADGQLQLENLTELEDLIFATAGVSTLDLRTLTKLKTLDVRGSTNADLGKLTSLDLSNNTNLVSVNVNRNRIAPANFVLPTSYASLTDLDLGRNGENDANVKFTVPQALYDQIKTSGKENFLVAE